MDAPLQSVERQLLDEAVARLERTRAFSVVFGGLPSDRGISICSIRGNRHNLLPGLSVDADRGLGGRALSERRPRIANDYRTSRHITHDYDREVLSEEIRTLLAVPVLLDGEVRGVMYGGVRGGGSLGSVAVQPAVRAAGELAREISMLDRVTRLARSSGSAPRTAFGAPAQQQPPAIPAAQLEELRASDAELRSISASVDDPAIAARLHELEARLMRVTAPDAEPRERTHLSPRETDVLGFVALGRTSGEIATELGLTESTVKSYLATGMRKLGARTRHEAVAVARRQALLP